MDVSKVNDINALKVMAYDAMAQKEQHERNLQIINNRIAELSSAQVKLPAPAPENQPNRASRREKK